MKLGASFALSNLKISDLVETKRIGFDFVEFSLSSKMTNLEELELQLVAVRDVIDSYELFSIIHLPHLNSKLAVNREKWSELVDLISNQIDLVGKTGISNMLVFHGVFGGTENPKELSTEEINELKHQVIKKWLGICQQHNIKLLLENIDESVEHLLPVFNQHKNLGFTFDVGHANLLFPGSKHNSSEEKINDMITTFQNQLEHIHLHDNFGGNSEKDDLHLPAGLGKIDFHKLFNKLREINYNKTITLEIYSEKYSTIYLDASYKVIKQIIQEIFI